MQEKQRNPTLSLVSRRPNIHPYDPPRRSENLSLILQSPAIRRNIRAILIRRQPAKLHGRGPLQQARIRHHRHRTPTARSAVSELVVPREELVAGGVELEIVDGREAANYGRGLGCGIAPRVDGFLGEERLVCVCEVEVAVAGLDAVDADAFARCGGRHERVDDGFAVSACGDVEGEDGAGAGVGDEEDVAGGAEGGDAVEGLGFGEVGDFGRGGGGAAAAGAVAVHVEFPDGVGAWGCGDGDDGEVAGYDVENVLLELGDAEAGEIVWECVDKGSGCFLGGINLIDFGGVKEGR